MNIYLGIDFGTSGARAIAIDAEKTIVARGQYSFPNSGADNNAAAWQKALFSIIEQIPQPIISGSVKQLNVMADGEIGKWGNRERFSLK